MEIKEINLDQIEPNTGQVAGLPKNPRAWSVKELAKLKASIEETPELVEVRPPILYPLGDKYIVLGGNMRLEALRELGRTSLNCVILPADTPIKKLKEIVIKDNSKFGAWDFDALANEWGDYDLADYGIPVYEVEEEEQSRPGEGNARPLDDRVTIEIELSPDEFTFVTGKLRELGGTHEEGLLKLLGL